MVKPYTHTRTHNANRWHLNNFIGQVTFATGNPFRLGYSASFSISISVLVPFSHLCSPTSLSWLSSMSTCVSHLEDRRIQSLGEFFRLRPIPQKSMPGFEHDVDSSRLLLHVLEMVLIHTALWDHAAVLTQEPCCP